MKLFIIWLNVSQYIGKKRKTLHATSAVFSSSMKLSSHVMRWFLSPTSCSDGFALSRSKPFLTAMYNARKQFPITPPCGG